jgi:hypothetical protein
LIGIIHESPSEKSLSRFQQPRICGKLRERQKERKKFDHGFVAALDELNSENMKEKN